jgi:hypothetical protein
VGRIWHFAAWFALIFGNAALYGLLSERLLVSNHVWMPAAAAGVSRLWFDGAKCMCVLQ